METSLSVPGDGNRYVAITYYLPSDVNTMTSSAQKKLITANAVVWAVATLLSFILPMVTESITDGRANFLKMAVHVGPLVLGLFVSTAVINRAIGQTAE